VILEHIPDNVGRPHIVFCIGKGGVGKTTVSILTALELSAKGRTLLVSLDPAKHLVEYLGLPGAGRTVDVGVFHAYQFDVDAAVRKLSEELSESVRSLFPSLRSLNLDDAARVAKFTPGLEEEAYIREVYRLYSLKDFDFVVVDTPPTGVMLRILALPRIYLAWLSALIDLREKIVSLRYTIARALGRSREIRDEVLLKLYELRQRYAELLEDFRNSSRTSFVLIANPEPLPVFEVKSVLRFLLEELHSEPRLLVLNKVPPRSVAEQLGSLEALKKSLEEFCSIDYPKAYIPLVPRPPSRLDDVKELLKLVKPGCPEEAR